MTRFCLLLALLLLCVSSGCSSYKYHEVYEKKEPSETIIVPPSSQPADR